MGISARVDPSRFDAAFSDWYRFSVQRLERAALIATDRGTTKLKTTIRNQMRSAGLGNLGNAIGSTSDLKKGGIQKRYAGGGFSASGIVYVRSRSERTIGALTAYTQGANIRPKRGRWLWIPTDDIRRRAGSNRKGEGQRLTPDLWRKRGLDQKVGPLTFIRSVNGYPLLVLKNVGVSLAGKKRSARSLTKSGRARKGQVAKQFVVAFIGIPFTSRQARIDVRALHAQIMAELPALMRQALGRI